MKGQNGVRAKCEWNWSFRGRIGTSSSRETSGVGRSYDAAVRIRYVQATLPSSIPHWLPTSGWPIASELSCGRGFEPHAGCS